MKGLTPNDEVSFRRKKVDYAILLVDFQNEFAKPGGKLHHHVSGVMEKTDMIAKVTRVVKAARNSGGLVIHSPAIMKADECFTDTSIDPKNYRQMRGLFTEGTWNCNIIDELTPDLSRSDDEVVLTGRTDFSAFEGTGLQELLEKRGVKNMFVAGFLTNGCVEETARAATERLPDLRVVVLTDGCAATSTTEHRLVIKFTMPLYYKTMTCAVCLTKIRSKGDVTKALPHMRGVLY
eukprot:CAMPEP_0195539558 /NCGR_PEP_ID=MMETSP0794_2-20130614/50116_1 /TAXON_ID=515487 /ORGANISM="Stephanopyxis turris, Strain CCMP 815" /LENGTH=234 /DNA_ID=CAMNT_0040673595 /DNA_START=526 /DNA_END=1230 /DNA_ORIENTATION=+